MYASPERSGALYRLADKKAEAVKARTKTLFPVPYNCQLEPIYAKQEPKNRQLMVAKR